MFGHSPLGKEQKVNRNENILAQKNKMNKDDGPDFRGTDYFP